MLFEEAGCNGTARHILLYSIALVDAVCYMDVLLWMIHSFSVHYYNFFSCNLIISTLFWQL